MEHLPQEAAERLARVTRLLQTQRSLPAKLEAIVAIVKRTVPGCDASGIILIVDGEPTTSAVTDRLTVEVDLVQYDTNDGPCLAAINDGEVIRIDVMERDARFSRVAPGALAHDVNSVLSMPLAAHDRTVGALNIYSHQVNAFDAETVRQVQPLADYAAEVIGSSPLYAYSLDLVEGLLEDFESRTAIVRATGVLIATEGLSGDEAMDRLRHLALSSGESMRTVADWLLDERPLRSAPADSTSEACDDS
jgi:GAF domain-containing protein